MRSRLPHPLRFGVVAGAALLVTALVASPASAAPAATVTPATGLRDLQVVQVSGTEFPPDTAIPITQCVVQGGVAAGICYGATRIMVTTDATGAFTAPFVVRRVIVEAGPTKDCADAPGACGLNVGSTAVIASPLLEFDPAVPPNRPALQLAPAVGVTDGATVQLTGTGFTPDQQLRVAQCRAGGFGLHGCDPATQVMANSDANGSFSLDFVVRAAITAAGEDGGPVDCTVPPGCAIVAANDLSASEFANAAIGFGAVIDEELPRTGSESSRLAPLGVALLLLGLATSRRPRAARR
jgi:hypothetical protein